MSIIAVARAEVAGFVHVKPETVKAYRLVHEIQLISPVLSTLAIQEVRERSIDRPDSSNEWMTVLIVGLDEDALSQTIVERLVVLVGSVRNASIDNGNVVHRLVVESLHELG